MLDLGSGTGAASLLLARELEGARVTAVDLYPPFLAELAAAAELLREVALYQEHGHEYGYVGYVLRPRS